MMPHEVLVRELIGDLSPGRTRWVRLQRSLRAVELGIHHLPHLPSELIAGHAQGGQELAERPVERDLENVSENLGQLGCCAADELVEDEYLREPSVGRLVDLADLCLDDPADDVPEGSHFRVKLAVLVPALDEPSETSSAFEIAVHEVRTRNLPVRRKPLPEFRGDERALRFAVSGALRDLLNELAKLEVEERVLSLEWDER